MQLRSRVAAGVAQSSSSSSDLTPRLGASICHGCGPKKQPPPPKKTGPFHISIKYKQRNLKIVLSPLFPFIRSSLKESKPTKLSVTEPQSASSILERFKFGYYL